MKNIMRIIGVFLLPVLGTLNADGEGGAIAAGLAAGLFSGIATSAIANNSSSRSDKAAAQAEKAREETAVLRREQERERVEQLRRDQERRELDRKDEQIRQLNEHLKHIERQASSGPSSLILYLLFGFILLLSAAVGVLALVLFRGRR